MRLLILDNYDSFTYNLKHYAEQFCNDVDVYLNDQIELDQLTVYSHIILSPGPGLPKDAGIMPELLKRYASKVKIMGVCLGMQAIVEHYGGKLRNLDQVLHGVQMRCVKTNVNDSILNDLQNNFSSGHYHSWVADERYLPSELLVTSHLENSSIIMSVKHVNDDVCGIQFHPESILTDNGISIIKNWLKPKE